jgi:segregation and condensation protein B
MMPFLFRGGLLMSKKEHEELFDDKDGAKPVDLTESTKPEDLRILEALLFASDELMTAAHLKAILPGQPDARKIRGMVEKINVLLQKERHPFEIVEIGGGYQFRTITFYHPWVRRIFKEKAIKKLSIQALECLAIIAYKQPISKADIEAVRGVVSDGAMKTLLEKRLVTISGRSDKPGRPLLYATTTVFLTYFGLNKIEDLPRIEEFEALAREKMDELTMEELNNPEEELDENASISEAGAVAEEIPAADVDTEEIVFSPEEEIFPKKMTAPAMTVVSDTPAEAADNGDVDTPVFDVKEDSADSGADDVGTDFEIDLPSKNITRFSAEDIEAMGGALMETKAIKVKKLVKENKKMQKEQTDTASPENMNGTDDTTDKSPLAKKQQNEKSE